MQQTGVQPTQAVGKLAATLHYIEVGCTDLAASASFYERALGYTPVRGADRVVAIGADRRLILREGSAKQLISAGFALTDGEQLARLRDRVHGGSWPSEDGPTPFFDDAVMVRDPEGHVFAFGLPSDCGSRSVAGPAARLQHVVLATPAPAPIVNYLTEVVGFSVPDDVLDEKGDVRVTFLRCGPEHHSMAVFKASTSRLDHHSYETSGWMDIRDWADHMAAERIPLQWGPGRHGPGNNLFMFVHDPDGNWIELSAELEVIEGARATVHWPHEHRTLNTWGLGMLRS